MVDFAMSSSPGPVISSDRKKSKKGSKSKKGVVLASQANEVREVSDNEYQPPIGSVLLDHDVAGKDFDWDEIKKNDDLELWVIRVPDTIKPKHLDNLTLSLPSSSHSSHIGMLSRKHTTYDVWSIREEDDENSEARVVPVGGEEALGLTCMLPRKKKRGKLYRSSKPITHHLIISGQPSLPTPNTSSSASNPSENPRRYSHPKELLKHRFMPYGSLSNPQMVPGTAMDVENVGSSETGIMQTASGVIGFSSPNFHDQARERKKEKKRKGDVDTPKKVKKVKTGV